MFSVLYEGRELFPAFQFSGHGRPLRRVAEFLEILRRDPTMTDWDIAISWDGEDVYPAFQFDDQKQPLAVMAEVLTVLRREAGRSDWRNLFWFVCHDLYSDPPGLDGTATVLVRRGTYGARPKKD